MYKNNNMKSVELSLIDITSTYFKLNFCLMWYNVPRSFRLSHLNISVMVSWMSDKSVCESNIRTDYIRLSTIYIPGCKFHVCGIPGLQALFPVDVPLPLSPSAKFSWLGSAARKCPGPRTPQSCMELGRARLGYSVALSHWQRPSFQLRCSYCGGTPQMSPKIKYIHWSMNLEM